MCGRGVGIYRRAVSAARGARRSAARNVVRVELRLSRGARRSHGDAVPHRERAARRRGHAERRSALRTRSRSSRRATRASGASRLGPLAPGLYIYSFNIDGVATPDPYNADVKLRARSAGSIVVVPGAEFPSSGRRSTSRTGRSRSTGNRSWPCSGACASRVYLRYARLREGSPQNTPSCICCTAGKRHGRGLDRRRASWNFVMDNCSDRREARRACMRHRHAVAARVALRRATHREQ